MPARGVAPAAPAAPVGLPPPSPATAGLPQGNFWGSLFQGLMQAPAYEQQQLQLDMQRLQSYEQYYNAIVPQVLANRPLAGDPRMISILSTSAKQAGVPAPIILVNGKPQIDVDALGRQALNNFIEKNSDLWYGKWSSTQRVSFAQRMGWIPPGYNWQADDAFTAQQSETLPEQQKAQTDYIKLFNDAVKSNNPVTMQIARRDYDEQFGQGAFERDVPGYKTMLKQVANNFALQAAKMGLDFKKEVVEIDNEILRGEYTKAETDLTKMKTALTAAYQPALDMSLIEERSALTRKANIEAQNALTSGQKLPAAFMQNLKTLDGMMSSAVTAAQNALTNMAYGTGNQDQYTGQVHQNLAAIRAIEPQFFASHLLLDQSNAQTNPQSIPGMPPDITTHDALDLASQLLQVRTTQGIMAAKKYYVKASETWNPVMKWLTANYPDLMNYVRGEPTSFEKRATVPGTGPSSSAGPTPAPAPKGKRPLLIPVPESVDDTSGQTGPSEVPVDVFLNQAGAQDSLGGGGSDASGGSSQ